jgi:hypothetical protein
MRTTSYALPHQQFLIRKPENAKTAYRFLDFVGSYGDPALRNQMTRSTGQIVSELTPGAHQTIGARLAVNRDLRLAI